MRVCVRMCVCVCVRVRVRVRVCVCVCVCVCTSHTSVDSRVCRCYVCEAGPIIFFSPLSFYCNSSFLYPARKRSCRVFTDRRVGCVIVTIVKPIHELINFLSSPHFLVYFFVSLPCPKGEL